MTGEELKKLRENAGLTQSQAAELFEVSRTTIWFAEGQHKVPALIELAAKQMFDPQSERFVQWAERLTPKQRRMLERRIVRSLYVAKRNSESNA